MNNSTELNEFQREWLKRYTKFNWLNPEVCSALLFLILNTSFYYFKLTDFSTFIAYVFMAYCTAAAVGSYLFFNQFMESTNAPIECYGLIKKLTPPFGRLYNFYFALTIVANLGVLTILLLQSYVVLSLVCFGGIVASNGFHLLFRRQYLEFVGGFKPEEVSLLEESGVA